MMPRQRSITPRPPWITADGYLDMGKIPIDGTLRQSLSEDSTEMRTACQVLSSVERFPVSLVEERFERLCGDKAFSVRMREKPKLYLERLRYQDEPWMET